MNNILRTMALNEWKFPLIMSVILHLALAASVTYLPGLLKAKPRFAKIQTVRLVNLPDTSFDQPESSSEPSPPAKVVKKTAKKVLAPEASPPPPVKAAPKAVSLTPRKTKKIKKKSKTASKKNNSNSAKLRKKQEQQRRLQEALAEQRRLEEEARRAEEALKREQALLNATASTPKTGNTSSKPLRGGSGSSQLSLLENRYFASVTGKILQFWALPEYMKQNRNLNAVVVITVNRNGSIDNLFFERSSGNQVFDQFVRKTLQQASPLPEIPAAMKKQRMEIGLKFSPGGIQ